MKSTVKLSLILCCLEILNGCHKARRIDTITASVLNPAADYRATVLKENYVAALVSDVTIVYITSGPGQYKKAPQEDFPTSLVAVIMAQCGPLKLKWQDNRTLSVVCVHCGRELSDASRRVDAVGSIRVVYEGFTKD